MTWDEWEQARGRVAGQGAGVRLDQLPAQRGTSGGGGPDLASRPAEKKAAARAIEEHLEPDTRKAGAWADEETGTAVKEFAGRDGHGWVTSGALKRAHKAWSDQVKALMDRLGSEKDALRSTSVLFQRTDAGVGAQVRQPSGLDLL
ncbi:hypothetical protein ACFYP4_29695 [Streptomyces sp. NPDC005551]|uniref:hypothetical protein n=1 Tax=unclassified Streptomyces TaxID=2593676 RepID=UPI0033EDA218